MSNAHEILAAAMGRAAPVVVDSVMNGTATVREAAAASAAAVEEDAKHVHALSRDAIYWATQTRNSALVTAALLALWLFYMLYQARRRYRGTRAQPVPIDYAVQRRLLRKFYAPQTQ